MINVVLYTDNGNIIGFEVSGHSTENENDADGKLVCSAVSSAAIMTANTITDVIGDDAKVVCHDGYLKINLQNCSSAQSVLNGFKLHILQLESQYPDKIKVTI